MTFTNNNSINVNSLPSGNHVMLRAALEWATLAPVFPLKPGEKKPLTEHGKNDASQLQITVNEWWNKWPHANIGIVTLNLLALDFDEHTEKKTYGLSQDKPAFITKYGELPKTRVHKTGGGGEHWIYSIPHDCGASNCTNVGGFAGIEIKAGKNGTITVPPSKTTGEYQVLDDSPIAPAPEWLIELAKTRAPRNMTTQTETGAVIPDHQRNSILASLAGTFRARGMNQESIEVALLAVNATQCQPPLTEREVKSIAASYGKYPAGDITKVTSFNFTDSENAEYFTEMYSDNLRYDHRRGRWLEWAGHYWRTDNDGQITRLALKAIRDRYHKATEIEDLKRREAAASKAISSEQRARLSSMLAIAQDLKPIADTGEKWDTNPYLFAAANTVIDLRTGQPIPGSQADMITMVSTVKYDPEATCPRWIKFQNELHPEHPDLVHWKHKFFGLCLSGIITEQIIPIAHGKGQNGKSVELNALQYVLGKDYSYAAPFTMFELDGRSLIPNDLAQLDGKRFVTARETTEGSRFNEGRIKALTGGDSVTARFLHCEFFTFEPTAKFYLAVNDKPRVHDQSYGFWRRVKLIPYNQTFNGERDDKNLKFTLQDEATGILNWLIEGFLLWQKEGLGADPECITIATNEYEADSDPLAEFLTEKCVINNQARVQASKLYKAYSDFCHNQGMKDKEILGVTSFGRRMGKNYKKSHDRTGTIYQGLALSGDEFVTGFDSADNFSKLNENLLYARENNIENSSQPVTEANDPSQQDFLKNNPSTDEIGELED